MVGQNHLENERGPVDTVDNFGNHGVGRWAHLVPVS